MKRLDVRPGQRGIGLGRSLATRVLEEARPIGFRRIGLDTPPSMTRVTAMCRVLGFEQIPADRDHPVPGTRDMALAV